VNRLRNFGFLLKDVSRLSSKNFERHANEVKLGLTLEQCKVMIHLQRNQGITQVRLAYLAETDPMTLVRILDRMEQDGWLERRPDPEDRRVWRLHLKPAALPIMKRIWDIADHARSESLAGLDNADIDRLMDLLEKIHGNLSVLMPGATEPERRHSRDEPAQEMAKAGSKPGKTPRAAARPRARTR
jgi:MarR family transcriptional regulator, transcriptional regulator for hemolysin